MHLYWSADWDGHLRMVVEAVTEGQEGRKVAVFLIDI